MKRWKGVISLLLLACLLLTACGTKEAQNGKMDPGGSQKENPQDAETTNDFESGEDSSEEIPADRREVVLVMVSLEDSKMEELAKRFNDSQTEYYVRLEYVPIETIKHQNAVTYTAEAFDEAMERLKISLTTGNNEYDVIWLNDSILQKLDAWALTDVGLFEDLGSWLDREGGLEREDFFDMVLTAFTLHDTLFSLPAEFQVQCLYGSPELLGDETEWTLRDFLDLVQKYPDMRVLNCSYPGLAVYDLYHSGELSFVYSDENGDLIFDDKLLSDFLEFCKSCPSRQGERGLFYADINLLSRQNYLCRDTSPKTFIGYPSWNAQNGCLIRDDGSLSMLSTSDCKEGAWALLEFFLLHRDDGRNTETNFSTNDYSYPAIRELFEKRMSEELYVQWMYDENGEIMTDEQGEPLLKYKSYDDDGVLYPPRTEEDVAFLRDFLVSSCGAHLQLYAMSEITKILTEEMVPYFEDKKTLEETVNLMKNRMMLYYQEQL